MVLCHDDNIINAGLEKGAGTNAHGFWNVASLRPWESSPHLVTALGCCSLGEAILD